MPRTQKPKPSGFHLSGAGLKALKELLVAARVVDRLAVSRESIGGFYERAMEVDLSDHKNLSEALAAFEPHYRKATRED